jgi:uncharacterized protein YacL
VWAFSAPHGRGIPYQAELAVWLWPGDAWQSSLGSDMLQGHRIGMRGARAVLLRLVGALTMGTISWRAGMSIVESLATREDIPERVGELMLRGFTGAFALGLFGAGLGYLLSPLLIARPLKWLYDEIRDVPAYTLVAAAGGLMVGLLLGALAAIPLGRLPDPFGQLVPLIAAVVFAYLGVAVAASRPMELYDLLGRPLGPVGSGGGRHPGRYILLDTSVIIDGRIADVARTGFIERQLLVPRFVLNELQHIADSSDPLRRNRGRRGLEVLARLQKEDGTEVIFTDLDVDDVREVDRKLVRLAAELECPIMTNDYNLNRVAELQGVRVLNLNELSNAVKTLFLPGESLMVRVIQEGKEHGQGVGYLDDGTMVVVDNGREHINAQLEVTVTRVLQTVAGRMIFATPNGVSGE